ncbi:AsmA-like C-terminal region-containing protein [Flavobacterium ardleyense]|uniref:AsmA-like C-terminal region-containing protein n=1 Tax=Flavobacterium ardleyense TaxID=2038737 RepID=UPI00298CE8AB|nr:AsmA-like C-terminal region-containing protein [Flavobacterium ardleyense]
MTKRIFTIIGVVFLLLIIALFAAPFIFQDAIKAKIAQTINKNVDATVSFKDVDLSFIKSFPDANVSVDHLVIINKAPFAGDTLVSFGTLDLKMSIKELFKGDNEPMNIDSFTSDNGQVNIIFNKDGVGNFDIALKDDASTDEGNSAPLALKLKSYKINNLKFVYFDQGSNLKMVIDSLNHSGSGDFAASKLDLVTTSQASLTLDMDGTNYMRQIPLKLDAVLGIDLENSKYTFKENKAIINQLPLEFNGFIQLVEAGQQYDLTFKTPSSSFTNFLALVPAKYSGSLANIKTTGDFSFSGFAKGLYSENTVPAFNLKIASNNASFKYPDLPKSVQNIVIDAKIINDSGILNDTYVDLDKLTFAIDQDVFSAKAKIRNVVENPLVDAALKGTINLGNLSNAYPIKLDKPLQGILKADLTTKFDMQAVEDNKYEKIDNAGTMSISNFKYVDDKGSALNIATAAMSFNTDHVNLQQFDATTGKSDISAKGRLDNFYGFLFRKQELKGNFSMTSNQLSLADFMTAEDPAAKTTTKTSEALKIPSFLNVTLSAKANTVLYDNLVLKNVAGKISIKDEKATLEDVTTNIFGGLIAVSGNVSTKEKVPTFNMTLGLKNVDIAQTFTQLEMLKSIAPIAGIINGQLNSTIHVGGNLDAKEMTPNLASITGDLMGQLLSTTVNAQSSTLLTALDNNLNFIDLSKVNLNNLSTYLTFENGKVNLKPFDIKYQDIKLTVGGQHGFDQSINYKLNFDVPAKYLGTEANKLLASLTPADAAKIKNIPINANLTGNFKNPKIQTDTKQAVTALATQLVQMQKDKLVTQGTNALSGLLNGLGNNSNTPKDTTKTSTPPTTQPVKEAIQTKANDILNGLFNKKKKPEPATPPATTP